MIHPTAIVHPNATIAKSVEVGPYCIVGEHVTIDSGAKLLAHVVVNGRTSIGADTVIYPFTSIGAPSQDRKAADDEVSYTKIGARTTIREYVSIHRGTGDQTVTAVGDDSLLLAYVHVAHNCRIGNHVTMSNLAQLAGGVVVEDYAGIGGMAGIHQGVRVGRHAFVGGYTKIGQDVPPFLLVDGNPPQAYGLNTVGLRRHGIAAEARAELKEAYKTIYRSERNLSQAIAALREQVKTPEGRALLAFLEGPSERGILK
ncbi:acyl-[acyl-carrier-protein]--UDP-N-acetylglucosamine O-acyltransferase [Vulcanimicrobium alpinum]|uniref:Acyl-[acyl-carrier-protein]--UDP-N-acetylglucosamine O-acyltransferase n=1 Tax=Vulcanimicrobium alpinum TaxID=3016050 RepID=A0AAN2C8P0_UNVUL|nr:acyl-ACP--UDP-N-acetylglucosamine O-acyltransferase [Vulcanimicrobium alpinum]BDE04737.1 acyl-[acyl-carrier-protein]--UDP-N-acetylglucosamine O-acyltransferase [Vulcanimicrobium alpinum]